MENLLPALPAELNETNELTSWKSFEIQNDMDAQIATDRLQFISSKKKTMDAFRENFIRPQKRILADFEAKCRQALAPFIEVETILRNRLGAFMDRERKRKHEELEAQRLIALEEAKAKQRELEDKILFEGKTDTPIDLQMMHVKQLETMDVTETRQTIRTSTGRVAESLYWSWEVTDLALIPQVFFVL